MRYQAVNRLADHRGFTLLELVACLGLMALLAAIVLRVYGQGTFTLAQAGERGAALDYAVSILEELRADPALLARASAETLTAAEAARLYYDDTLNAELTVSRVPLSAVTDSPALPPGSGDEQLYKLSLRVSSLRYPGAAVELTTLLRGEGAAP